MSRNYKVEQTGEGVTVTLEDGITGQGWTETQALEMAYKERNCPTSEHNKKVRGDFCCCFHQTGGPSTTSCGGDVYRPEPDRSHEECAGCQHETTEPPVCSGHVAGPSECIDLTPKK